MPGELLETVYGGRYDKETGDYTGEEPERIVELSCHPGQVGFLTEDGPQIRTMALGPPGGGKSFAAVRKSLIASADQPHSVGGVITPVSTAKRDLMDQFLEVAEPAKWVAGVYSNPDRIELVNGTVVQFWASLEQSTRTGIPFKHANFDWAVEDEHQNMSTRACQVLNLRGRRAGMNYRIWSTATNDLNAEFQHRLREWYNNPEVAKVVPFIASDNVFVDLRWWDIQKHFLSAEDYRRLIEGERTVPGVVYHAFDAQRNVRRMPDLATDVTAEVCNQRLGKPYRYVVGFDPGSAQNASHVLKAFRDPGPFTGPVKPGEMRVLWFVVGEFVTKDTTTREHAEQFSRAFPFGKQECIWLIDPHVEGKETDQSDRNQIRQAGMDARWASAQKIPQKHRFQMVNALWCDATGHRRLFWAADAHGKTLCPLGVQSAQLYRHEDVGKKGRGDLSHYTDTVGYALFPFEYLRGNPSSFGANQENKWGSRS